MAFFEEPEYSVTYVSDFIISRYMDLARFLSLLLRGAMFFCRADKIGDPWEAQPTRADIAALKASLNWEEPTGVHLLDLLRKELPRRGLPNCWYGAPHESTALWGRYTGRNAGVAVRSTVERVEACFRGDGTYIGRVRYLQDFDAEQTQFRRTPNGKVNYNYVRQFLHKGVAYEWER